MLINEVCSLTKLTKKAIEYYEGEGLIKPNVLENGYRDFSADDVETLKKISILRKLELSTNDIRNILNDGETDELQKISARKALELQRKSAKQAIFDKFDLNADFEKTMSELEVILQNETITEKLLDAFPGYYGRFIALHFSCFLNSPIETDEQKAAYDVIIDFLDNSPSLAFPPELQAFLIESTKHINTQTISDMNAQMQHSIENPEEFLEKSKEMLDFYLEYKQSEEYKKSPTYQIQLMLKEFNNSGGYYDIFIPAMKKLSPDYCEYYKQLELANEKLLAIYPEIEGLDK